MSYVLGWKTRSNIYIAADSAITGRPATHDVYSSFGERHILNGSDSVAERAQKIVVDDDLAIGLCGDFSTARDLASFVFDSYQRTQDLEATLHDLTVSTAPFPMKHDSRLVIAWRSAPFPRLFSFNHDGNGTFHELKDGEGVPLGSVSAMHRSLTQDLLRRLFVMESQGTGAYLAAALGALQSFGIHDYLLTDGVGGTFTGLCVSHNSITWQPDILYVIDEPGNNIWSAIATCTRDGSLIVNSTVTNATRVFTTITDDKGGPSTWWETWGEFAQRYLKTRIFDFVVLLGSQRWVVIVIEMKRASESVVLRFLPEAEPTHGTSWFELHSILVDELQRGFAKPADPLARDFRFRFEPYRVLPAAQAR